MIQDKQTSKQTTHLHAHRLDLSYPPLTRTITESRILTLWRGNPQKVPFPVNVFWITLNSQRCHIVSAEESRVKKNLLPSNVIFCCLCGNFRNWIRSALFWLGFGGPRVWWGRSKLKDLLLSISCTSSSISSPAPAPSRGPNRRWLFQNNFFDSGFPSLPFLTPGRQFAPLLWLIWHCCSPDVLQVLLSAGGGALLSAQSLSNWCVVTQLVISPVLPVLSMLDLNCEPSVLNSLNATFSSTILLVAPSCCCSSEGVSGGLWALT